MGKWLFALAVTVSMMIAFHFIYYFYFIVPLKERRSADLGVTISSFEATQFGISHLVVNYWWVMLGILMAVGAGAVAILAGSPDSREK